MMSDKKQEPANDDMVADLVTDEATEEMADEQQESEIPFDDLPAEQQVVILQQKLAESSNDVLRAVADVQNMRKRTDEEIAKQRKYGCATLARDLFSVADNLRMAVQSISADDKKNIPALNNLSFGLDMVVTELQNAFDKNGITQILPTAGDDFDHNLHQAMGETETTDIEAGKIAFVMSAGYMLHDRLLKPALINVAKAPESEPESDTDTDNSENTQ